MYQKVKNCNKYYIGKKLYFFIFITGACNIMSSIIFSYFILKLIQSNGIVENTGEILDQIQIKVTNENGILDKINNIIKNTDEEIDHINNELDYINHIGNYSITVLNNICNGLKQYISINCPLPPYFY